VSLICDGGEGEKVALPLLAGIQSQNRIPPTKAVKKRQLQLLQKIQQRSEYCCLLNWKHSNSMKGGGGKHDPNCRKRQPITEATLNTKRRKKEEAATAATAVTAVTAAIDIAAFAAAIPAGTLKPPPAAASPAATAAANITCDTKKAVDNGKDNSEEVSDKFPRDAVQVYSSLSSLLKLLTVVPALQFSSEFEDPLGFAPPYSPHALLLEWR
jgi:hypothetical protein